MSEITDNTQNEKAIEKARLIGIHGENNVFDTTELQEQFEVIGFDAPFCVVRRKSDGIKGSMEFQHTPRFYFDFMPF